MIQEIRKYFEVNESKNITYQKCNADKAVPRRKFIAVNACIQREKKTWNKCLNFSG